MTTPAPIPEHHAFVLRDHWARTRRELSTAQVAYLYGQAVVDALIRGALPAYQTAGGATLTHEIVPVSQPPSTPPSP